jgi:hypothetical protein
VAVVNGIDSCDVAVSWNACVIGCDVASSGAGWGMELVWHEFNLIGSVDVSTAFSRRCGSS